jgi:hypothetical protein
MIAFLLNFRVYAYVGAACLIAGFAYGWHVESNRFAQYRGAVEAAGKAQELRTEARIAHDGLLKEEADEDNRQAHDRLAATIARLRRDAGSRVLPTAAACPASPEGADRLRADHQRAYRDLVDGLRAEALRGDKSIVDLNTAKEWARWMTQP